MSASSGRAASISRSRRASSRRAPSMLKRLHNQPGIADYKTEILDHAQVAKMLPDIGPEVVGGSYCPLDGHVNSLRLFRALHTGDQRARRRPICRAIAVEAITHERRRVPAARRRRARSAPAKVVLAAGNANMRLAPMVGLEAPMRPERGQIIVTERLRPFLQLSGRHPAPDRRRHGDDRRFQGREHRSDAALTTRRQRRRWPSARVRMFPLLAQRSMSCAPGRASGS